MALQWLVVPVYTTFLRETPAMGIQNTFNVVEL